MPAPVAPAEKRSSSLLTVLFWIGVALAPVAALILLVADGNAPLRFGAVLAILAVVLIGLSIALRAEGGGGSAGSEHMLAEVEQLRRELRSEIVAAAQRGNQALDQAQRTQEAVAALRRRLDVAAAGIAAAAGITAPEESAAGRVRVPGADTYDDPSVRGRYAAQDEAAWGQPAADRRDEDDAARRAQSAGRYGAGVYGTAQPGVYGAPRAAEHDVRPEPAPRQVGVVHHTETVHVTTRHTIVDGAGADPVAGNLYGGGYAGRWSPAPEERPWAGEPEDRSRSGYAEPDQRGWSSEDRPWTGQAGGRDDRPWAGPAAARDDHSWAPDDDRAAAGPADRWAGEHDERSWAAPQEEPGWAGQGDARGWAGQSDDRSWGPAEGRGWAAAEQPAHPAGPSADASDDDYWSEMRTGGRWAAVRDDEHGREVRVGERRAAVHADGGGTEYRVEDRWASVRRSEPRPDQDRDWDAGTGWAEESRPALPVGGVPVPDEWRPPTQRSGQPEWRTAEPEPATYGRSRAAQERYGYPPQDDVPRAGGARSSDRWR